jgi:hypothetical protein
LGGIGSDVPVFADLDDAVHGVVSGVGKRS